MQLVKESLKLRRIVFPQENNSRNLARRAKIAIRQTRIKQSRQKKVAQSFLQKYVSYILIYKKMLVFVEEHIETSMLLLPIFKIILYVSEHICPTLT